MPHLRLPWPHRVCMTVENGKAKTVIIDSLNGYQAAMPEENSLILHPSVRAHRRRCQHP